MIGYVLLFFLFGFLGWVIDTSYRSIQEGRYIAGTYFPFFAMVYAIGGMTLLLFFQSTMHINILVQILVAGVLMTLLELITGIFCIKILKKRLWDYSKNKWHYEGHIDLVHAFYWLLLAVVVRVVLPRLFF